MSPRFKTQSHSLMFHSRKINKKIRQLKKCKKVLKNEEEKLWCKWVKSWINLNCDWQASREGQGLWEETYFASNFSPSIAVKWDSSKWHQKMTSYNKVVQWEASIHCNWPMVKYILTIHWLFYRITSFFGDISRCLL